MKNPFTSLREFFNNEGKRPAIYDPTLGLTERDINLIRTLRGSDEWQAFLKVLDVQVSIQSEQLLHPQTRDDAVLHELRGVLLGLRKAAFLVAEITQKDDERKRHESERAERESERAASDPYAIALFGSPAFKRS